MANPRNAQTLPFKRTSNRAHYNLTRWLDGDDIAGISRGTIKTIYPALVFLDHTFTSPYLHEVYNEHFDRNRLRRTPKRTITPLVALTINDLENCLPYTHEHALSTMLDSYSDYNRGRAPQHRQFRIPILDGKQPGRDIMRERLNAFGQHVIDQRRQDAMP